MSFNFFKNFAKVKGEQLEEGIITLAAALDQEGVAETAIKQKMDEHEARIALLQEATEQYRKEQSEYDQELALYQRYMNEAETIQQHLDQLNSAKELLAADTTNQDAVSIVAKYNEAELTSDLVKILDAVEKRAGILEKEKQEADEAKEWMIQMKESVDEISKDLLTLRETLNSAKRDIEKAKQEKERNQKRAEQAEVIAGLRKSGNKFDVAMNALKNKAEDEKREAEKLKIKADSLKKEAPLEETLLGKYSTSTPVTSNESLTDRLARLKQKA